MNKHDIQSFEAKLKKEAELLESELATVGKVNSSNHNVWEATSAVDNDTADENEVADKMEELEENGLILGQLEKQLADVHAALDRIAKGTYGICEISGEPIEKERLEAIPSARTCKAHMNTK